jgi:HSP20 family protein
MAQFPFYDERSLSPACDVSETEEKFLLSVDLPGMKKEDIKIELKDQVLTISGERKTEKYQRSFTLPTVVDGNKVEARYEDGVLELTLPKTELAKPRQIEILS